MMFLASKIAEELAAASEVRGISAIGQHTSRREVKFKAVDVFIIVLFVILIVSLCYLERMVK